MPKTYTLDEIRRLSVPLAKQYGLNKLAVFGSYARGEQKISSDIDFLIDKGAIRGAKFFGFITDLEEIFDVPVDVLTYESLSTCYIPDAAKTRWFCMSDRDTQILRKVIQYADEVAYTIDKTGLSYDKMSSGIIKKNTLAMCVLQIGELVGHS